MRRNPSKAWKLQASWVRYCTMLHRFDLRVVQPVKLGDDGRRHAAVRPGCATDDRDLV